MLSRTPKVVAFGGGHGLAATLTALRDVTPNITAVVTVADKPAGRGQQLRESAVKTYAKSLDILTLQPEKLKEEEFIQLVYISPNCTYLKNRLVFFQFL